MSLEASLGGADVAEAADALMSAAVERTGLRNFGPEQQYMPGLRTLLQAIHQDVPLTPAGQKAAFGLLLAPLISRLYAHEGWSQRPSCVVERPITAPVIILGLPRTGTTALHRLLSFDPQFQGPELWLMEAPMPRPPRAAWNDFCEFRQCAARMAAIHAASPMWNVIHPRGADLIDETLDITKQCFTNNVWGSYFPVPSYDEWWPVQDHAPQYRYLRRVLQLVGADDARTWLLKDPTLSLYVPETLDVFPDARLIFTHRDPLEVLPSVTSVVAAAQALVCGDRVDVQRIAARDAEVWSIGANRIAADVITSRPHADVYMRAFQSEPIRAVHEIYDKFGLTLSAEAESAMRTSIVRDRAGKHGAPRATLADFQLDAHRVRKQFAPYIERFGPFDAGSQHRVGQK